MTILRRVLLPWGVTFLTLVLCLVPTTALPRSEESLAWNLPYLDKAVHFGLFAGFGLFWARAGRSPAPTRSRAAWVLAAALALAVGTELLQGLPQIDRDPELDDALADAAGAVVGIVVSLAWGAGGAAGGSEG